ncbi:cysteine hydrolase [Baekduia soli]|uniref:Cysteine hydrolase n=1 Tax=Baekduia soli TaxID=496014 RepID=A0A5B8U5M7_9ACTN|nr:cysteine hydrolase [Baekduia soli]QEC48426.1 cysteine hydrolase [Baekduia soli]
MTYRAPDDYVSTYTRDVDLDPATTCLVIVDLMYATGHRDHGLGKLLDEQGRLDDAAYRFERIDDLVVPNTLRLLAWAREHDMRRIFLTYGSEVEDYSDLSPQMEALCRATRNREGCREHQLLDCLEVQPTERVINKITPSAFTSSPIELILHTYGVQDLIFTGVSTNMCVEGTLRDAADKGFGCLLVDDACGADSQEYHDNALLTLQRLYCSVSSTDDVLGRLDAQVGHAARSA